MGAQGNDRSIRIDKTRLPPTPPDTEDNDSQISDGSEYPLPPPTTIPAQILDIDKKTPDQHVPRDPRLIRLTGVHPFNVEPPLTDLFNEGMSNSRPI
jgi:nitrate reductase (NAD(P)H)